MSSGPTIARPAELKLLLGFRTPAERAGARAALRAHLDDRLVAANSPENRLLYDVYEGGYILSKRIAAVCLFYDLTQPIALLRELASVDAACYALPREEAPLCRPHFQTVSRQSPHAEQWLLARLATEPLVGFRRVLTAAVHTKRWPSPYAERIRHVLFATG